ncbi:hypothetical protein K493DRAFT_310604 [Basidiobolus meristosporus CBS 931.73]|uniref:VTT domain-containing protein n=1 Tax=Basidiobolus meristosporus CBS 931.73 TaxID=1314790 RepID=A0A1Y1Z7Q0_9FUNG|nr:hypothetical protein K493DRAFT_310604 [Basidiobolus meristosporus CBS 931.73]|eukprot:ORY06273.1 hypothetical protein K493DRAFT_310604 [Basidiobolus meristosporus CBS 931.73]
MCYYMFYIAGRDILERYIPNHLASFRYQIESNRSSLFLYLLTIRLFPLSPYWLINIISPFVGVPVWIFFVTCMLGILPYTFVTVEAGQMLSEVESISDILDSRFMGKLFLISAVPIFVSIVTRKRNKSGSVEEKHEQVGFLSSGELD